MTPEKTGTGERDVKEEWTQISGIAVGLDEQRLPSSDALAGRKMSLHSSSDPAISLDFIDETTLRWEQAGSVADETYDAVEIAPLLFVAGFCHRRDPRLSTTFALDLESDPTAGFPDTRTRPDAEPAPLEDPFGLAFVDLP